MSKERELLNRSRYNLDREYCADLIDEIQELLAQPEQTEQEPVAWIIETEIEGKLSEWICTDKKHYMNEHDATKDPIPLYTAPPKREPLSEDVIWDNMPENPMECSALAFIRGVKFAEKEHGIGENDE